MKTTTSVQEFKAKANGKSVKERGVIFALNSKFSKQGELAFVEVALGRSVKQLEGCYKGERETSYWVSLTNSLDLVKVQLLALGYKQESILLVDENRDCELYFLNLCTSQPVGKLYAVTPAQALSLDNWTRDGNQFYTTGWEV